MRRGGIAFAYDQAGHTRARDIALFHRQRCTGHDVYSIGRSIHQGGLANRHLSIEQDDETGTCGSRTLLLNVQFVSESDAFSRTPMPTTFLVKWQSSPATWVFSPATAIIAPFLSPMPRPSKAQECNSAVAAPQTPSPICASEKEDCVKLA